MMKWENRKLYFKPNAENFSLNSHASMPIPIVISEKLLRVFFSSRDKWNSSYVNYVDLELPTFSLLGISDNPVLSKGDLGHFDDNGVYSGAIVQKEDKTLMFYSGRANGVNGLYYMNIGLAESRDNGNSFKKVEVTPILSRSKYDPWMVTAPSVFKYKDTWKMIYTSGISYHDDGTSRYNLKMAESIDIVNWKRNGKVVIELNQEETNISTPTVLFINDKYHLWFSTKIKNGQYKIGYAYSIDCETWVRNDDIAGIIPSSGINWDSDAVSYPSAFIYDKELYLCYCGNEFGKSGFGIAKFKNLNLLA